MQRNYGIETIRAKQGQVAYGMGLGIMLLDEVYPGFPGDVRNASTYTYPVQYEIMEGLNCDNIAINKSSDDEMVRASILKAAKRLEQYGCKAIIAECGYFCYYQKMLAGQVNVPVFMSSLIQVPIAQQAIGPNKAVGIFCAQSYALTDEHLTAVGIALNSNYHIKGITDNGEGTQFLSLWYEKHRKPLPEANYELAEKEIVKCCVDYVREYPDIGAIVLECTGFPPFAHAIQRAIDMPVYSFSTLMDYAYLAVAHRDFYGRV